VSDELREQVFNANLALVEHGLVLLTFGNVSGIDRERGIVAIKPSGVPYDELDPSRIVLLDLDGGVIDGDLRPSSDTPTHLVLYRAFPEVGGITHTHSTHATIFAQAGRGVPCFGTTHADVFYGEVPCTRVLTADEVRDEYEVNTGSVIVERFGRTVGETPTARRNTGKMPVPREMPAVLVAGHGPFTWGGNAMKSVENAAVLEEVARTALGTIQLDPQAPPIPQYLLDTHYLRKHGSGAYYGQTI
jgi:L-ribulose-5-phosphate 4-epimerase